MKRTSFLTAALLLAAPLSAQSAPDCSKAVAQSDLNQCAAAEYEAADKQLNLVWKQAREKAKEIDSGLEGSLKGAEEALLAAQRGWIAYRDGHCKLAGFEARGGSMEPMLVSGCLAETTRLRTRQLQDFVAGEDR
jgi:Uncharacterized protein conserved in bacteria